MNYITVIPAKAGTHLLILSACVTTTSWVPAFAGMTAGERA